MKGVVDISLILCDAGDTFRASQQEARHPFPGLVPPCLLKPCHELKKSESEKQTEKKKKRVKKILVLKDMFTWHSQKLQLYLFCRSWKFWLLLVREICKRCEESPRGIKTYRVIFFIHNIFLQTFCGRIRWKILKIDFKNKCRTLGADTDGRKVTYLATRASSCLAWREKYLSICQFFKYWSLCRSNIIWKINKYIPQWWEWW